MSKISFNLDKIEEKNGVAFYEVSGFSIAEPFYLEINRFKKSISIYLTNDFTDPIRVVDTIKNFPIAGKDGIDVQILAPVFARSIDIMKQDSYPLGISYAA
jgi:hypothetical protein